MINLCFREIGFQENVQLLNSILFWEKNHKLFRIFIVSWLIFSFSFNSFEYYGECLNYTMHMHINIDLMKIIIICHKQDWTRFNKIQQNSTNKWERITFQLLFIGANAQKCLTTKWLRIVAKNWWKNNCHFECRLIQIELSLFEMRIHC